MVTMLPVDRLRFDDSVPVDNATRPTFAKPVIVAPARGLPGYYDVIQGNAARVVCAALRSVPVAVLRLCMAVVLLCCISSVCEAWPRQYHDYQRYYSRYRRVGVPVYYPRPSRFEVETFYYYQPRPGYYYGGQVYGW